MQSSSGMVKKTSMRSVTPDTYSPNSKKVMKYYPTFTLDLDDIPEAEDWAIGNKYNLVIQVEQIGIRKNQDPMDGKENESEVTFKLVKVRPL